MIRKKLSYYIVAALFVGLLTACGGGGGGNDEAPATPTAVTLAAGQVYDAGTGNITYIVPAGAYTADINNFGAGDKLVFPAGSMLDGQNLNFTDGDYNILSTTSGNQTVTVQIHDLPVSTVDNAGLHNNPLVLNTLLALGTVSN